jgi:ABC-2 type transport system permease protein
MKEVVVHLGWELRKIYSRPVAWIGIGATLLFQAVIFALLRLPSVRVSLEALTKRVGIPYDDHSSGLTQAVNVAGHSIGVVGAIFVALLAGESISREIESGTLRMVLSRPVTRWRVWTVKLIACSFYLAALAILGSAVALGLGVALEGWGPLHVQIAATGARVAYAPSDGLLLYCLAIPFHALSIFPVLAAAFALSSCGVRGSTAAVASIAYFMGERVLLQMPFLASARHWFLMSHMTAWTRAFEARPDWGWVSEVYIPVVTFSAIALVIGFVAFTRRDFKP